MLPYTDGLNTINGIIGCEYGKTQKLANPKNLWTRYFTSSKFVEEFRKEFGEPDVIEVRKTFQTAHEAVCWEDTVLRRINAVKNEQWLNQARGGKEFISPSGPSHYAYGRPEINSMYGKQVSEDRKRKQSEAMKGRVSNRKGCKLSDETKRKLSEFNLGNNSRKGATFSWITNRIAKSSNSQIC